MPKLCWGCGSAEHTLYKCIHPERETNRKKEYLAYSGGWTETKFQAKVASPRRLSTACTRRCTTVAIRIRIFRHRERGPGPQRDDRNAIAHHDAFTWPGHVSFRLGTQRGPHS